MSSLINPRAKLRKSRLLEAVDMPDDKDEAVDGLIGVPWDWSDDSVAVRDDEGFLMPGMPGLAGNALFKLRHDLGKPRSSSKVPSRPQD